MKYLVNVFEKFLKKYPKVDKLLYGNVYRQFMLIVIFNYVLPISWVLYLYFTNK